MPKKSKLNSLNQTHGKIEDDVKAPRTLDQIFGDDGSTKYGTLILEEYAVYLNDLNKSDLQSHANKMGLVPIDNREILISRLKKEFVKHVSAYNTPKVQDKKIKNIKTAKDILSEGR